MENASTVSNKEEDGQAFKKRGAERQMRREEDVDDQVGDEEMGTWKRADENVISQRRIVRARKSSSTSSASSTPSPFQAALSTPSTASTNGTKEQAPSTAPSTTSSTSSTTSTAESSSSTASSTAESTKTSESLSTTSAPSTTSSSTSTSTPFTFNFASSVSSSTFSLPTTSSWNFSTTSMFGTTPSFNFSTSSSSTSLFSFQTGSIFGENIAKPAHPTSEESSEKELAEEEEVPIQPKAQLPPPEPVKTGEEDETHAFQSRAKLFVLDGNNWRERGIGELRVNVNQDKTAARILMRTEKSLRLILNCAIWPSMKFDKAGDKGLRFTAPSVETPGQLCGYLVRVGKQDTIEELINVLEGLKKTVKIPQKSEKSTTSTTSTTSTSTTETSKTESSAESGKPATSSETKTAEAGAPAATTETAETAEKERKTDS